MKTTRREALLLGGALASVVRIRANSPELTLKNRAGVTVRPIGGADRPTLGVSLPESPKVHAAVIELPEHAWHRTEGAAEPVWFYKMYTEDASLKGQVTWSREGSALHYIMRTPSGFTLAGAAELQPDGLRFGYEIGNPTGTAFAQVQAPTCIKLYRPFTDVFLERTFVHYSEGLDLLAAETPERLTENAEEWLPCRYIAACSSQPADVKLRERGVDGITRYRTRRPADVPFIATESNPKGWVAATHALAADSVWTNPARTCQHADPSAPLPAHSKAKLALEFYLTRGGAAEAWRLAAEARRPGKV